MAHQLEVRVVQQMSDVGPGAGIEVVDAQHFMAALDQPVAEMRAEEAGTTGDQDALAFEEGELAGHAGGLYGGGRGRPSPNSRQLRGRLAPPGGLANAPPGAKLRP